MHDTNRSLTGPGTETAASPHWRRLRLLAVFLFIGNWISFFLVIHKRWAGMDNHVAPIALLALLPFPCLSMFVGSRDKYRVVFSPSAAIQTYLLLLLAELTMAVSR